MQYTQQHYNDNYGELTELQLYPATHKEAETWLEEFLNTRFAEFGPYEDAIVAKEAILNHSVLSPLINVGLLTPQQVIEAATDFAEKEQRADKHHRRFCAANSGLARVYQGSVRVQRQLRTHPKLLGFLAQNTRELLDGENRYGAYRHGD